ncbi:MAG: J domain-containing protein [Pseudomonadota bacterium]
MAQSAEHAARVLGLVGDPTLEGVRRARKAMALKYHPDRCGDTEKATRHMARINAAADALIAHLKSGPQAQSGKSQERRQAPGTERRKASARNRTSDRGTARTAKPKAKTKRQPASRSVRTEPLSDAARRAWKTERALAEKATASYQNVLSRIGRSKARKGVDLQILRFEPSAT